MKGKDEQVAHRTNATNRIVLRKTARNVLFNVKLAKLGIRHPHGSHRIRHYGLLSNPERRRQLATVRTLLDVPTPELVTDKTSAAAMPTFVCRSCGAAMRVVEIVMHRQPIRAPP